MTLSPDKLAQDVTVRTSGTPQLAVELTVGETIGDNYLVLAWIGAGGMGNVYKVMHTIMQTEYALKTLSPDKISENGWLRFKNEAQAIARLNHPNIVGIYNLGLHEGYLPYYVMDLLKGETLKEKIRAGGSLALPETLAIFKEVAAGLGYAHKKGIVHRDIKPENIMILRPEKLEAPGSKPQVKIVDFGIAKLSGSKDEEAQKLTSAGEVFGSPFYMSPEQCQGGRIDARSDIYSLGCSLFESLTGLPPFRGNSMVETMLMHQQAPRPTLKAASRGQEFPPVVEQMVATMMAIAPINRYQSVERLSEDLEAVADGAISVISPYRSGRNQHNQWQNAAGTEAGKYAAEAQKEAEAKRAFSLKALSAAAGLTIAVAATTIWWLTEKPSTVKAPRKETAQTKTIAPTLALRRQQICRLEKSGKDGHFDLLFDFPTDINLGEMRVDSPDSKVIIPCQGRQKIAAGAKIYFFPSQDCINAPDNFGRLVDAKIYSVTLPALAEDLGPQLDMSLNQLRLFKNLHRFDGRACTLLKGRSLYHLNTYPILDELALDANQIDGAELADVGKVASLRSLSFAYEGGKRKQVLEQQVRPLLIALINSRTLQSLDLAGHQILPTDLDLISRVTSLKELNLSDSGIESINIVMLSKLGKLEKFTAQNCKLDVIALSAFKGLASQSLKDLDIRPVTADPRVLKEYRKELPHVVIQ